MHNEMAGTPIAVVGYAYRAPGVGRRGLWEFLVDAKSAFSRVPEGRFKQDTFYHPDADKTGCFHSKGGHFLPDDIYAFDAPFFNLRPDEARAMDPQHRLTLECALEATENAGITLADLAGSRVGVFASHERSEYGMQTLEDLPTTSNYTATGTAGCMFANRLSYFFGLSGPSIAVDAACAGSSYALHLASQSIRSGECRTALVSASSLITGPEVWVALDQMGALSAEGKCFPYDSKASGFGRGEGSACLVLKPLSDALAAGDAIRAVIRNTAANHSGRTQGITMPSRAAQEALARQLHAEVGLDPHDTDFVEGHGTGTPVGDPLDAGAVAAVSGRKRTASNPVHIGSIKSNIGHLEAASGLLSVVKSIMMLEHKMMLPNANFENMNPKIEERERLRVLQCAAYWPCDTQRRVCVTNYGFGGSNASVLLEEAPKSPSIESNGSESAVRRLFVLSAKSESSLSAYVSALLQHIQDVDDAAEILKDLSFTLGERRTHHSYRNAVQASSIDELEDALLSLQDSSRPTKARELTLGFIFTGQGAGYARMATELFNYPIFASALANADDQLTKLGSSWSLAEELEKPVDESRINEAEISQPACTAIQIGLVLLLRSWGIAPNVVIGHSSGEIASAFAAGIISFEAAIAIAYFRGCVATEVLKDDSLNGAMLALGVGAEDAEQLIRETTQGYAVVGAINSPGAVTVSGDETAIQQIQEEAESRGLFVRRLQVGVAYHSRHMEKVAATYEALIRPSCNGSPHNANTDVAFVSSVTGKRETIAPAEASYWVKNLVSPVRFSSALEHMTQVQDEEIQKLSNTLIEIGPHAALKNPTKQTLGQQPSSPTYLPSLIRGQGAIECMLDLASNLYASGADLKFGEINKTFNARLLTDLPPYQWNHTTSYIHRPRVAQQKMLDGTPYDPFLGWKSPYREGKEETFRNVFTLDGMPWIRDHHIAGDYLFPFTGFFSLAAAALRSLTQTSLESIVVKELYVKRSLMVAEEQKVDVTTKLRPAETGTESTSSSMWSFEVLSWSQSHGWVSHCYGRIETGTVAFSNKSIGFASALKAIDWDHLEQLDANGEYRESTQAGTDYGPAFRTMTELWEGLGVTVHTNILRQLERSHLPNSASPVSIDPPTLDSFLHGLGLLHARGDGPRGVYVPTYVSRMHISNHIPADPEQKFTVVTRRLKHDSKNGQCDVAIAVFAEVDGSKVPVLDLERLMLKRVKQPSEETVLSRLPESYYETLTPHVDLIEGKDIAAMVADTNIDEAELESRRRMNRIALSYSAKALKETEHEEIAPHMQKFRIDAQRYIDARPDVSLVPDEKLLREVCEYDASGKLLCKAVEHLPAIIRGEIQPLEILLQDGLLWKNYEEDAATIRASKAMAKYVRMLSAVHPNMRILEIGGGTGGSTLGILEAMSSEETPAFDEYTFTDISTGFFEKAREKFAKWEDRVVYQKLDIGVDPAEQGFDLHAYDMVVAVNVLHATPSIAKTLSHVRSLVKSNGKLLMMEVVNGQPLGVPFSVLPSWWLVEDDGFRKGVDGPILPLSGWDKVLSSTGFSGVEGSVEDYPGRPEHTMAVLWATATGEQAPTTTKDNKAIHICGVFDSAKDLEFAEQVSDHISSRLGLEVPVQKLSPFRPGPNTLCIFIDSRKQSVFKEVAEEDFKAFQSLLQESAGVLWIIPEGATPEASMIKGMLRTLRLEDTLRNLLLLENLPYEDKGAVAVAKAAERLRSGDASVRKEQDMVWKDNFVQVPRLKELKTAKRAYAEEAGRLEKREQGIFDDEDALEMTVASAGDLDSIHFRRTDILSTPLDEDEILIKVEAAAMNFRDLLLVLGSLPWHEPGLEGAGVVTQVGSKVKDLKPGDRVFYVCNKRAFANHVRLSELSAAKITDGLSTVEAASMPVAFGTAIMALERIGNLQAGESVLIHAASGAVGQACIMLAKHLGARIFATAGTPEKRQFLVDTFDLSPKDIFSSRTPEFRVGILNQTEGKGVDVIVNSLSGDLLQHTWELIAEGGRFVEIGRKDFLANSHLGMRPFDRNVTFAGVDLQRFFSQRPAQLRETLSYVVDLIERKVIRPIRPITTIPISQVQQGLRKLQQGQNIGKIVVTVAPEDRVLAECPRFLRQPSALREDTTVLITGGTGGIGRSLAGWLLSNGAGNVVLLGRSGSSSPAVAKLLRRHAGRLHAIACDVGNKTSLISALDSISHLPPVRGVIHGALYLRDALFVNSTYKDWQAITAPKNDAAWYLHDLLPDLDFFISLGSVDGVLGHVGQAIYAGTSSFLDEFTAYRLAQGKPAISIGLPVVEDVGYVAKMDMGEGLKSSIGLAMNAAQIHTLVKGAIIGPSSGLNHNGRAITFGRPTIDGPAPTLPWEQNNFPSALRGSTRSSAPAKAGRGATGGEKNGAGTVVDVLDALTNKVAAITMMDVEELSPERSLTEYGLDSLVSVELRNWIRRELGVELALTQIVGAANLQALAEQIRSQQ